MFRHVAKRLGGAAIGVVLAGMSVAATVSEADFGGDFSDDWRHSSEISSRPTLITGRWSGRGDADYLSITGLAAGAQTLDITFSAPDRGASERSFAAAGAVLHVTGPYRNGAWRDMGIAWPRLSYWDPKEHLIQHRFTAGRDGRLRLGLYGLRGTMTYRISGLTYATAAAAAAVAVATPPAISPVPVPTAAWFLITGLGALAVQRRLLPRSAA